jgi:hypothetical protein
MDLFNEAYYQIYSHLSKMSNVCGENVGCIFESISRPFLLTLYSVAHAAAPQFLYTVSSTAALLGEQSRFFPLYAGIADVYDIHMYSGGQTRPGDATTYLPNAKNLTKPWFVGEAGCADQSGTICSYDGGSVNCTLPTACSLDIDTWWLENLRSYGASAVLVENAATAFSSFNLTTSLVGQQIIKANAEPGLYPSRVGPTVVPPKAGTGASRSARGPRVRPVARRRIALDRANACGRTSRRSSLGQRRHRRNRSCRRQRRTRRHLRHQRDRTRTQSRQTKLHGSTRQAPRR